MRAIVLRLSGGRMPAFPQSAVICFSEEASHNVAAVANFDQVALPGTKPSNDATLPLLSGLADRGSNAGGS
ncbi:hypothetical protein [Variovorax sp. J22R115]|uniref:hypothetical protein n=1 Tax=Variovorax sp. J22R115 TaxID=3053509 RepID=UPI002574BF2A|nr:hypothetical protein [Variovorax sp. J22R115]MDM0047523.1 hypothetical protein [Variovorax sp. J22R115]